jgi:hypothetical protein
MLSKHQVDTPMSGFWAVKRGSVMAFLLMGLAALASIVLAAFAYAKLDPNTASPNAVAGNVPEIAVGAGISAFVLAGGGLLLLADRLRGKKKSKS